MNAYRRYALAVLLTLACGCRGVQEPNGLPQCQGPVTVTVDLSAAPTFSWTPSCRASTLIVDPISDVVDYWVLTTVADTNGLRPPIVYGTTPSGSKTLFGPVSLQAGTSYRARVLRATGDATLPFQVIGATLFKP